jgi:hypothetical protein
MQVLESMCHNFAKYNHKYMKVKHQLELLYFQADKILMYISILSIFHIMFIIYQNVNVKVCWKIKQLANLKHTFHPFF